MTKIDIIKNNMYNKIVSMATHSGDYLCGRVSKILEEENCIELVFRNGDSALIDLKEIKFIAPIRFQPSVVI